MSTKVNYYELLGVSPSADPDVIRAAYRALSKKAHPDAGGTEALFNALKEAYDTLMDPLSRERYNMYARMGQERTFEYEAFTPKETYIVVCVECGAKNKLADSSSVALARCGACGFPFKKSREHRNVQYRVVNDYQATEAEQAAFKKWSYDQPYRSSYEDIEHPGGLAFDDPEMSSREKSALGLVITLAGVAFVLVLLSVLIPKLLTR